MRSFKVEVKADLLQRLAKVRKPLLAVAELVWNSVDADATLVEVEFEVNLLQGLERIVVRDDGSGMSPEEAERVFKSLGGSWKKDATRSQKLHRLLHGRAGKGRLRAFSLGATVTWSSTFVQNGELLRYPVIGNLVDLGTFTIGDAQPSDGVRGTEVTIESPTSELPSLRGSQARLELTQQFAPYLAQYADVKVKYDGEFLRPEELVTRQAELPMADTTLDDGRIITSSLKVVEWNTVVDRALFLCDENGFALCREAAEVYAPGFSFTAYLTSDWVRQLHDAQLLELDELRPPEVLTLLSEGRRALRAYFRGRQADAAADLVADWKREKSYPFSGEAVSPLDRAKREVFDIVALSVSAHLPDLNDQDVKSRRFSFRLLREALEESPAAVQRILLEVLELPKSQKEELAALLEEVSLNSIIGASKLITDRLDFLRALELLVFEPTTKSVLLERQQLHRILERYTWLFGEQFTLTASDKSLNEVLSRHLWPSAAQSAKSAKVKRADDRTGIVDLMLSRRIPHSRPEEREHLIIELKRPAQRITLELITQIKSYANAVANDERFRDTNTQWEFWLVSNELDGDAKQEVRQRDRPIGLVHDNEALRIRVWVKTWSQLIEDARARLHFFQTALNYEATDDTALALLRSEHQKHIPPSIKLE